MARREVLSQLQQLECQLTAIESTARTVEGELLASNQVEGVAGEDDREPCWGDYVVGMEHSFTKICAMHCRHVHNMYMYSCRLARKFIDFVQTLAGI